MLAKELSNLMFWQSCQLTVVRVHTCSNIHLNFYNIGQWSELKGEHTLDFYILKKAVNCVNDYECLGS